MKIKTKLIDKKNGYWVGFGDLEQSQIKRIKKLKLSDGTYKIEGFSDYIGVWTDEVKNIWTEKSRWFREFTIAYKWGKARKEKAIWDCKNSWNIWLIEQPTKKLLFHVEYKNYEYWIYED